MNKVVAFEILAYFRETPNISNKILFPCLHSLILTLTRVEDVSKVMRFAFA